MIELQNAAAAIRSHVPVGESLQNRLLSAMRYAREHDDVFFMCGRLDDDMRFRAALGAVMLAGSEEDKETIERSLKPMRMLAAAAQGVPVDFGALEDMGDLLPLMKLWKRAGGRKRAKAMSAR